MHCHVRSHSSAKAREQTLGEGRDQESSSDTQEARSRLWPQPPGFLETWGEVVEFWRGFNYVVDRICLWMGLDEG